MFHPIARLRSGLSLEQAQWQANLAADRLNRERPRGQKWDVDLDPIGKPLARPDPDRVVCSFGCRRFCIADCLCQRRQSPAFARSDAPAGSRNPGGDRCRPGAAVPPVPDGRYAAFTCRRRGSGRAGMVRSSAAAATSADRGCCSSPSARQRSTGGSSRSPVIVGILTGVLCSLAPALRAARTSVIEGLVVTNRMTGATPAVRRLLSTFQALQVAFALVLLVGAGLMINTFVRMLRTPTGYDSDWPLPGVVVHCQGALSYPRPAGRFFRPAPVGGQEACRSSFRNRRDRISRRSQALAAFSSPKRWQVKAARKGDLQTCSMWLQITFPLLAFLSLPAVHLAVRMGRKRRPSRSLTAGPQSDTGPGRTRSGNDSVTAPTHRG